VALERLAQVADIKFGLKADRGRSVILIRGTLSYACQYPHHMHIFHVFSAAHREA
jgi:hypothetical protein